jgi:hypothetical protein
VAPASRFEELGRFGHGDGRPRLLRLAKLRPQLGADERVDALFEPAPAFGIGEDERRHLRAIDAPVGAEHVFAEELARGERAAAPGTVELPDDLVRVEDGRSQVAQQPGDGRFPGSQPSRQAHAEHGAILGPSDRTRKNGWRFASECQRPEAGAATCRTRSP